MKSFYTPVVVRNLFGFTVILFSVRLCCYDSFTETDFEASDVTLGRWRFKAISGLSLEIPVIS